MKKKYSLASFRILSCKNRTMNTIQAKHYFLIIFQNKSSNGWSVKFDNPLHDKKNRVKIYSLKNAFRSTYIFFNRLYASFIV